ncbi:hypothetical protein AGMMS49957_00950 [Synergistales bacterium]|nr:hypothetical protein AGMMS49957_00950 [Synergistales bacterium]
MIVLMSKLRTHMRWVMLIIVLAFLLSTFLMYDSGSSGRGARNADGRLEDYVVAEINGTRLMRSTLEQEVAQYVEQAGLRSLTSVDMPAIYEATLSQHAMEQQMAQEVRDSGITVSDAEAEQAMKNYADQMFPTREAFYQYLERSGIKQEDYKKNIAQQMASQRWVEASIGEVVVSEDEAVNFYDAMKDFFFKQPSGFMVNLATFASKDEAEKVRNALLDGEIWLEATSGDAVNTLKVKDVTSEPVFVSDSAFDGYLSPMSSDEVGAVSQIFEMLSDDFSVGIKTERVEEKVAPYDEVSADIRTLLQQQKGREAINAFSQGLLSRAKIVILDNSLFPSREQEVLPVTEAVSEIKISEDKLVSGD